MSTATHTNGHTRDALESRANFVLGELLRRIDVLDGRRQRLMNAGQIVRVGVRRHLPLAAAVSLSAIAFGVLAVKLYRARKERQFRNELARRAVHRLLGGTVAPSIVQPRAGIVGGVLRAVGMRLLVLTWNELARPALERAIARRQLTSTR